MVETHLIETFVEVVAQGSVTEAARALERSQPAVSHRLKQLEAAFGTPLFEKAGRGLRLTDAGRRLHGEAVDILDRLRALPRMVSGTASRGLVRIGLSASVAERLSPSLIRLLDESPRLRIQLTERAEPDLRRLLSDGDVDLALLAGEVPEAFAGQVLFESRVVVLMSTEDMPLVLTRDELLGRRYLAWEAEEPLADAIAATAAMLGFPEPTLGTASIEMLGAMVGAGAGFSLLPDYAVPALLTAGNLAVAAFESLPAVSLSVVMRADRQAEELLQHTRAVIAASLR